MYGSMHALVENFEGIDLSRHPLENQSSAHTEANQTGERHIIPNCLAHGFNQQMKNVKPFGTVYRGRKHQ